MPLTYSLPPGIREYFNAGKHFKSVITFFRCFWGALLIFLARVLTGIKGKAISINTYSLICPCDLSNRDAATDSRFRLGDYADFEIDFKNPYDTSWFHEKFKLNKLLS
jgi:hypothetical protein